MTTLNDIINDVNTELHGMTANLEQVTFLTADIDTNDLVLNVDDASQLSRGLLEIGDELMWVVHVNQQANTVTIAPFGRGYRSTTAAAHTVNTMITDNPRFPRQTIVQRVQQALSEIYPEIFVVRSDETNTVNPVQLNYPVPADCDIVLSISWATVGPSLVWEPVRRYNLNTNADPTVFATGRSVSIGDVMFPGRAIRVTYVSRPGQLVNNTDTLDDIGLDDNFRDILMYGACYRLVASLETSRLQMTRIEQTDRAQYVNSGAATAGSKYYLGLFQERVQNERARLLQVNQSFAHLSR